MPKGKNVAEALNELVAANEKLADSFTSPVRHARNAINFLEGAISQSESRKPDFQSAWEYAQRAVAVAEKAELGFRLLLNAKEVK